MEVTTFAAWAQRALGKVILDQSTRTQQLHRLAAAAGLTLDPDFLIGEVDYVLGRWLPADRASYLTEERTGRGKAPRIRRSHREALLEQVIAPYEAWKDQQHVVDWADLPVLMAEHQSVAPYDVVIVDEAQDFSANQVRAVVAHLAEDFVCTWVRDSTQRIYPNFFVWRDVGVPFARSRTLTRNYRNTRQIAAFARPLVDGVEQVEDGTVPSLQACDHDGPLPVVLAGRFSGQMDWAIEHIRQQVAEEETVAFLHPRGGQWFSYIRSRLDQADLEWVSLSRQAAWPQGPERIGLSTMHSAKGLEFDHVFVLGYNAEVVTHGTEDGDAQVDEHRRLLAMAVGRARKTVTLGYKPEDTSRLLDFLQDGTYQAVSV